jgi:hypothetical protein
LTVSRKKAHGFVVEGLVMDLKTQSRVNVKFLQVYPDGSEREVRHFHSRPIFIHGQTFKLTVDVHALPGRGECIV